MKAWEGLGATHLSVGARLIPSLLKSRMKVRGYSGGAHGRAPLHAQSIPSLSRIGISPAGSPDDYINAIQRFKSEVSW